ncbi:MAG: calcium/sodium antiporter [Verrucomicrobia bacterium]|nr:calcium/sodium antiporter [Verrucomicrobiota bacterium]
MSDILLLLGGLALIIKGGDWFVAAAVRIAEFLRLPRVVVGSTLVSLATTSPELVVSFMSASKGESGLAIGNAVGSCICNIGLILGVTALIKHVDIHPRALRTPLLAMLAGGVVLFLMTLDLGLSRAQGAILIAGGVAYYAWDLARAWRDRRPEDFAEATAVEKEVTRSRWVWFATLPGSITQFLVGAAIVVLGSRLLVDGAINIAGRLAIPAIIVGLTVIAIGTSLPELITAITSARKNVSDLSVGNVLGANIANLTLIIGTAAVIHPVTIDRTTQLFNFPALLAMCGLLLFVMRSDHRITRREGAVLLAAYGAYIGAVVMLTIAGSAAPTIP